MAAPCPVLLMTRQLGIGGTERQLCELAKTLDRSRFEPSVGCLHAEGLRGEELRAHRIPILELPVRSYLRPGVLRGVRQMGRYLRERRVRIVHTFDAPMNEFGAPVARMYGVPLVLSSQRAHRDLVPPLDRHWLRVTDLLVDGIVVNSQAVRRHLMADDRVPRSLIHVCYNGLDTARFQAGPRCRPPALREARLVIGVACAFRPEKGLETLLEAFAQVRPRFPGIKLLLVGDGWWSERIRAHSAGLGLGPDCHFEPAAADVVPWLRAMDIFVLPSLSEALSNSLMEAMACGCAATASKVGGNPELVEDGRTGLLFPAGDAAGLAACLDRLIREHGLRRELAAAGSSFIRQNFSLAASVRRMEEIYTTLLERGSSRESL